MANINIYDVGKKYINLKDEEKVLKKDVKNLNGVIKEYFDNSGESELIVDDKKIVKQVQDRSTMNESKLLEKMKLMNMSEAIKTREYVDVETVNNLIYEGKLSANDISDCVENKEVVTIRITKNK